MMKINRFLTCAIAVFLLAGCAEPELPVSDGTGTVTVLEAGISTRTVLKDDAKVLWTDGDRICVNGTESRALELLEPSDAVSFAFDGLLTAPYSAVFPSDIYKNEDTVTLPAVQTFKEGTFAGSASPMAAYQAAGNSLFFRHLCSVIKLNVKAEEGSTHSSVAYVEFFGNSREQVCGDFSIDYEEASLSGISSASADTVVRYMAPVGLHQETMPMYVVVPSVSYEKGYTFRIVDVHGHYMEIGKKSAHKLEPGKLYDMPAFEFVPSGTLMEGSVKDTSVVRGVVRDSAGYPIAGVVVSDGLHTAKTDINGRYSLPLDMDEYVPKFVFVSTPREYSAPVSGGLPVFYKPWEQCRHLDNVDFELEPNPDPDRYVLFMAADPQIRKMTARADKVAYHSIDAMHDLFRDLREYSASVSDRSCYGIVLGDIVHEDMTLYAEHTGQCATLGFPMYSVIGNHDHDTPAQGEDAQHEPFERHLGPRNYSVNMGKFHVISLDNFLLDPDNVRERDDYGLSDTDMEWLRNDLAHVSEDTPLIVCSHCTMFLKSSGNDESDKAPNGKQYAELLSRYAKVYHFAGHAHSSFNYIYDEGSPLSNVEVHILARSGGILWLNEYMASGGTPRGYLVCEVDGEDISWKWRVIPYLSGDYLSDYLSPAYSYRLWSYSDGVAYVGNSPMQESYQMTPYGKGAYPDGNVYACVYMWDELWGDPYLVIDGGGTYRMERVPRDDPYAYDAAEKELIDYYNGYHSYFSEYGAEIMLPARNIFRAAPVEEHASGHITVTDRFGNVYSVALSW